MREDRDSQLNPIAPNFHPRDHEYPRSQDSRLSAENTGGSPPTFKLLEGVFDGRTTSSYEITTSLPKPKITHEQYAGYAEINTSKSKEL
jgi:hypothetical protein